MKPNHKILIENPMDDEVGWKNDPSAIQIAIVVYLQTYF
jgi:hypothetical protein